LTVTNAVGALGAINGVADSYAEHVPVVRIAGSIPLRSIEPGLRCTTRWACLLAAVRVYDDIEAPIGYP
jgi:hypothetical protein